MQSELYWKNWHPTNTHSRWPDMRQDYSFRTAGILEALQDLAPTEREKTIFSAWANEALDLGYHAGAMRVERDVLLADRSRLQEEALNVSPGIEDLTGLVKWAAASQLRKRQPSPRRR